MALGRIGPLGVWDKFDEGWIGTRQAARWFLVATAFVLTTVPLFFGYLPDSGALGRAYRGIAGIGGAISIFFVWIGMWKYWARLDTSGKWVKRLWFLVMLTSFWYGSCVYCWCVYLPQLVRARQRGMAPHWVEQPPLRIGMFGKFLTAAWLCFVALLIILEALILAFPKLASAFEVIPIAAPFLVLATFVYMIRWLYRQGVHRS